MAKKLGFPFILIGLAAVARLIPHAWNFTPVGAVGLFAGAHCKPRHAWYVPLVVLLLTDFVLGFYDPIVVASVYLGFLVAPLIGRLMLANRRSVMRVGAAVWISATAFFVISNFGVWLVSYPLTVSGLIQCYSLALPFYGAALVGDALYATVFFGGFEIISRLRQRESNTAGSPAAS